MFEKLKVSIATKCPSRIRIRIHNSDLQMGESKSESEAFFLACCPQDQCSQAHWEEVGVYCSPPRPLFSCRKKKQIRKR
jgi:hypothetical protein